MYAGKHKGEKAEVDALVRNYAVDPHITGTLIVVGVVGRTNTRKHE